MTSRPIVVLANVAGIAALAAIIIFWASSNPSIAGQLMNSDQLTIPAFIVDVLARPYEFAGWQLPRSSYLFPDAFSYLIAYLIVGNSLLAIPLAMVPILLTWLYLVWTSVKGLQLVPLVPLAWTVTVALMVPLALSQYAPDLNEWTLKYYFSFSNHFSCFVGSVLLLHWSIVWLVGGRTRYLVGTVIVLALLAISNRAVWAYYGAPMLVTLLVILASGSRVASKRIPQLAVAIVVGLIAGYLGEASLNRITIMPYVLSVASIRKSVPRLFSEISAFAVATPQCAIYLLVILSVYALAVRKLWIRFATRRRASSREPLDARFLFDTALVAGGLGNILAAGVAWEEIASARYLMFFFFAPMLLLPRVLTRWPGLKSLFATFAVLAVLSLYWTFAHDTTLDPRTYAKKQVEGLVGCVDAIGGGRGLGGYWTARRYTFMSGDDLRIDQMTPSSTDTQHLLFYWANDAFSYLRGTPSVDPYTYVIADGLNGPGLESVFGPPTQKQTCAGHELWRYRSATQIFPRLFQGNMKPFERLLARDSSVTIPAGVSLALTGSRDGIGRRADPTSSPAGFLLYGGYLSLPAGNYRFTVNFTSSDDGKSAQARLGRFEVVKDSGNSILGQTEMTIDPGQTNGFATVDVFLPKPAELIEPRVLYHGERALRIVDVTVANGLVQRNSVLSFRADDNRLHTLAGRIDGEFLRSNGGVGVLLYGPYVAVAAGPYRASVHFTGEPPKDAVGKIDVAAKGGKDIFADKVLALSTVSLENGGYRIDVNFALPHPVTDLEVRVLLQLPAPVTVSRLEIAAR